MHNKSNMQLEKCIVMYYIYLQFITAMLFGDFKVSAGLYSLEFLSYDINKCRATKRTILLDCFYLHTGNIKVISGWEQVCRYTMQNTMQQQVHYSLLQ